ncbi:MAG TPA: CARDB domain-containing protein [Thermomicrobiales bacterium]|nr:CARDB domain-containing protein [Thermomicrobiales bacterium]
MTVRNQGNVAAGHSYVRFNEWPISVAGLAPGAIRTMRFYRKECEVNSTISVDASNEVSEEVSERNESNNRMPRLVLC